MTTPFKVLALFLILGLLPTIGEAQLNIGDKRGERFSRQGPKEYEIGGIQVLGAEHFDPDAIKLFSGLSVGDRIKVPGEDISEAIKKLWDQDLFADVSIHKAETRGNTIFLVIKIEERPRLTKYRFEGISNSDAKDLREQIELVRGKVITDHIISDTKNKIRRYYVEEGHFNVETRIRSRRDTLTENGTMLIIDIDEGERTKIGNIVFHGNEAFSDGELRRSFEETHEKSFIKIFTTSKFIPDKYEADKELLIDKYQSAGYRDAEIVRDTVYQTSEKRLNIEITVDEGHKYYFGDIDWAGNKKYSEKQLNAVLGIDKGDVFNKELLDKRLNRDPRGTDISSLYMDDGYLFFRVTPVEKRIRGDSIDMEMQVYEGEQARIDKIIIKGNTKTHEHVIRREIRTKPGELFDRSEIVRTQRELSQLPYIDPKNLGVNPIPDPEKGTVDIEYKIAEKPSDQIELSGGFGGGRIVGTLGLKFNNFSARKVTDLDAWRPLPAGDGQSLSIRAQSNGPSFQSYNLSFTEPWLGGKEPNAFSVSARHSVQRNRVGGRRGGFFNGGNRNRNRNFDNEKSLKITTLSVGLSTRLEKPDDFFTLSHNLTYQLFNQNDFRSIFSFTNGTSNNLSYEIGLSRNSVDKPLYPTRGSEFSLSLKATPPYSAFDGRDNYKELTPQEKFKWVEYHKWKFTGKWFTPLTGDLVLKTKAGYGFLGSYQPALRSPFEKFYLGGSGLTGFNLDGREIIALRGYENRSLSARTGSPILSKYTAEVRYPLTLNPQATIYLLSFVEGGRTWQDFNNFEPFRMKRSAGVGIRVFLPMFGLLGLDYGWGFDETPGPAVTPESGKLHFTIGRNLGEL